MNPNEPTDAQATHELTITSVFDAPRSRVFALWTDPTHLAQWWGPNCFTNPVCELDPRPGGAIRIHMCAPDGTTYPMTGVYLEVTPPERIVFTSFAHLDEAGQPLFEVWNSVTLDETDGKTTLTLRARVVRATAEAAPYLAGMDAGWNQTLDGLADYIAQGGTDGLVRAGDAQERSTE